MSNVLDTIFSLGTLWYILVIIYALICFALIGIVLIQKGKGAGFAGAFGVGPGTETIFGPRGIKSGIARTTYAIAAGFMVLALFLSLISGKIRQGQAPDTVAGVEDAITEEDLMSDTGAPALVAPEAEAPAEAPAESAPEALSPAVEVEVPATAEEAPEEPAPAAAETPDVAAETPDAAEAPVEDAPAAAEATEEAPAIEAPADDAPTEEAAPEDTPPAS